MTRRTRPVPMIVLVAMLAAPALALPDPAIVRAGLSGPPVVLHLSAAPVSAARLPADAAPVSLSRPGETAPLSRDEFATRLAAIAARLDCLMSDRPEHDC